MALFNFITQGVSWMVTITIARILVPKDYGLMSMSTILTGYAMVFCELGLGNAVIQRLDVTRKDLSSVFWFLLGISIIFAGLCYPLSFLTAHIMHEPRVIPITQSVALIFILNGLQIIPLSLIRKSMNFKSLGIIEMISTLGASLFMLVIAKSGGGVWTLLLGNIFKSAIRTVQLFRCSRWFPELNYSFKDAKKYISFGVILALGRSLSYIQLKSDKFFAGRIWHPSILGLYSFAQELSQIPNDKIVSIVNNVSFPAFAKVQNDKSAFNSMYLNITKVTSLIIIPLFVGGFFIGEDLIMLILDKKWYPMIPVFKILCISQIFTGLNSINSLVHTAQGRPKWSLCYNIISTFVMPASFYLALTKDLNSIITPWISSYIILTVSWILITIHKLGITLKQYLFNLSSSLIASSVMCIFLFLIDFYNFSSFVNSISNKYVYLSSSIIFGAIVYSGIIMLTEKKFIAGLRGLLKKDG